MAIINKLFWKRTYLFVEYSSDISLDICIKEKTSGHTIQMESKMLSPGLYRAKLNITIANGRKLLESGKWNIIDKTSCQPIPCSKSIKNYTHFFDRVFRFTHRFYSYIFSLSFDGDFPIIESRFFIPVKKANDEAAFQNKFFI